MTLTPNIDYVSRWVGLRNWENTGDVFIKITDVICVKTHILLTESGHAIHGSKVVLTTFYPGVYHEEYVSDNTELVIEKMERVEAEIEAEQALRGARHYEKEDQDRD